MNRRLKIAIGCTVLVLILLALLCFIPKASPICTELEVAKLDAQGNEIGTTQIHIEGRKLEYLFLDDRFELTIDSFDNLTGFKVKFSIDSSNNLSSIKHVKINRKSVNLKQNSVDELNLKYCTLRFNSEDNRTAYELIFTEDMDCFAFWIRPLNGGESTWYVVSLSGDDTTREIIENFKGIVPGY